MTNYLRINFSLVDVSKSITVNHKSLKLELIVSGVCPFTTQQSGMYGFLQKLSRRLWIKNSSY